MTSVPVSHIVEQNRLPSLTVTTRIHHAALAIDVDMGGLGVSLRVAAVGIERFDAAESASRPVRVNRFFLTHGMRELDRVTSP